MKSIQFFNKLTILFLAISITILMGCGGDSSEKRSRRSFSSDTSTTSESTVSTSQSGGSIVGKVSFSGDKPRSRPISFGGEIQCAKFHDTPPHNDNVVIGENGEIKATLIYIKSGLSGEFDPPSGEILLDQVGCIFTPRVIGAMVGQPIVFKNSDPLLHNVRSGSKMQSFNKAQPRAGMTYTHTFDKAEIGIPIRCDVHIWMKGIVHVLEHPFFAVTSDDGSFEIANVPAGTYTIEAWHEKLGTQEMQVTVADGKAKTANFTFSK